MNRDSLSFRKYIIIFLLIIIGLFTTQLWIQPAFLKAFPESKEGFDKFIHVVITIFAVFVGTFIDRNILFHELSKDISSTFQLFSDEIYGKVQEKILPMTHIFGVSKIHEKIYLQNIYNSLDAYDYIDILFTFHPDIETHLHLLVKKILENNVNARILIGSPESEALKARFNYIEIDGIKWWGGESMIANLKRFFDNEIPKTISLNREFGKGKLFCIKSYQHLPDIPLIIIRGGNAAGPGRVKKVIQGYYLKDPALDLPFIEWVADPDGDSASRKMANLFADYFDVRWHSEPDMAHVVD